jgi:hypothetical protein
MNEQDNKKEKPVAPGPRANDQGKIESISSTTRPRMAQEEQQRQEREMERYNMVIQQRAENEENTGSMKIVKLLLKRSGRTEHKGIRTQK